MTATAQVKRLNWRVMTVGRLVRGQEKHNKKLRRRLKRGTVSLVNVKPAKRMKMNWILPRRTFLKGLGTTLSLPFLESLVPATKLFAAGTETVPPRRMAFIYVPNGINMADWTPTTEGADFELPYILEPLQEHKAALQVLTGLSHQKADPNGDGAGVHARASATFLTGMQARKTAAVNIRVGVSVDQVAAAKVGRHTRLPSLELSCDKGQQAGSCDSGYSCAYQFNLAWKTESTPLPPEVDPRRVFDRLFSNGIPGETAEARARRQATHQSILDFVLEDARDLRAQLGATDRRKLDEYMTSVREIEQRIEQAEKFADIETNYAKPTGIPKDYTQHLRLLYDLLALAFQTDTTRVSTFLVAHDGSNRAYPFIGVSDGHHDLSHHGGN